MFPRATDYVEFWLNTDEMSDKSYGIRESNLVRGLVLDADETKGHMIVLGEDGNVYDKRLLTKTGAIFLNVEVIQRTDDDQSH